MQSIYNTGLQTTNKQMYLLALDTKDRLEIQFVPDFLAEEREADLGVTHIIGRNTPRYQYTGGETTLPITLEFIADEDSRRSVTAKCQWLKSLTFNDAGKRPAQRVILVFGELFKNDIWAVKSVRPRYSGFNKEFGMLPTIASVDIVLKLDVDKNLAWSDVMPDFTPGAPDGKNPINLGAAIANDRVDEKWLSVTNDNDFRTMLNRLAQNLRFIVS